MSSRVTQVIGIGAAVAILGIAGCGSGKDAAPAVPAATTAASQVAHTQNAIAPPVTPLRKGEHFESLSMQNPYTPNPPANGTDDYRCFLVDPKITKASFLTGSQFLPNNADIVHHAIFFKIDQKLVAEAKAVDAKAPGDGWTCFGGTGVGPGPGSGAPGAAAASAGAAKSAAGPGALNPAVSGAASQLGGPPWIAAWAPGTGETLAAKGTGYQLEPGSQIVMQVHYNLLATGGKAISSDKSGIRLRLAPGNAKLQPLHTKLLIAPIELPCPKGETGKLCNRDMSLFDSIRRFGGQEGATVAGLNLLCNGGKKPHPGNTQHCDRTVQQKMVVQAVAGHMHLLGRSIKVELNPGAKHAKTLLNVPVYDFDEQGAKTLAKPVTVNPGDDLRVTCTHDATLRAQLPALKTLKPRYVLWGEGTADEMCLGVVIWSDKPAA
jgi:hypothetical protein